VPHRSLRSALLAWFAHIPHRIGFDTSAGRFFFTEIVRYYPSLHEVDRNFELCRSLGIIPHKRPLPRLYPSENDRSVVDRFLSKHELRLSSSPLVGIAPGTVWNTKRWPTERFAELIKKLVTYGIYVVLIGGKEDAGLCDELAKDTFPSRVISAAGKFTLLQSAVLIQRCTMLISNDSAPMHLAVAMKTPVAAVFGATAPEFGFAPYGEHDVVVEVKGLTCRPCSIHGGERCPISTFDCMKTISAERVYASVQTILGAVRLDRL
jgi:heptosyltransferase-2